MQQLIAFSLSHQANIFLYTPSTDFLKENKIQKYTIKRRYRKENREKKKKNEKKEANERRENEKNETNNERKMKRRNNEEYDKRIGD